MVKKKHHHVIVPCTVVLFYHLHANKNGNVILVDMFNKYFIGNIPIENKDIRMTIKHEEY